MMINCKYCKSDCFFRGEDMEPVCKWYDPMTNADRIRDMTDEELGEFLGNWASDSKFWKCDGLGECLAWLKDPMEGE